MQIQINGVARNLSEAVTVSGLLTQLAVRGRVAVEINGELVPRSLYATHVLADGDRVEIVQAIGGGEIGFDSRRITAPPAIADGGTQR